MGHINDLPDEILEFIFGKLPPYGDLKACRNTCKRWTLVADNVIRYKKINLNKGLVDFNLCWKSYTVKARAALGISERPIFPAPRHSHSTIVCDNVMWVFGGSSVSGAFNDLWCFDLSSREWFHPKSTGNYPNPKACCSLVQHKRSLILFGGWRQATGMTHQSHILFNELHIYDIDDRRWTVKNFSYGPNPIAAHAATVHGDKMVVFGGFSAFDNEGQGTTNDVWVLDLNTWVWRKPRILDRRPMARYGHFQISLGDDHLMIMGGSGGPNNLFNDAWILNMRADVWKWESVTIRNKKFTASHMWCHPAATVGTRLVVLGPTPALPIDLKIPKQQAPGRLRPPPDVLERPRSVENRPSSPETAPRIAPGAAPNNVNDRLQRSLYIRSWDPSMPRRFNEPIVHGTIKMAAFNVDNNSQLPQTINRERQLENLRRMEQKLQRQRLIQRQEKEEAKKTKRAKTNCLAIFVCDFSTALTSGIEWVEYKNSGLIVNAPEKNILSSMVAGVGECIVFGGLHKEASNEMVTNAVHFLTVPQTTI